MVVRCGRQLELREDVGDVCLDGLRGKEEPIADRLVRASFGHEREDFALPFRQVVERDSCPAASHELRDDLRIDHGAAPSDPPDGVGEVVEVLDPILEEIADPAGPVRNESHREGRLDVLRKDQDPDRRAMLGSDSLGSAKTFVRMRRRHPDIDDGHIGAMLVDGRQELIAAFPLGRR